jgi:hypothetical protein
MGYTEVKALPTSLYLALIIVGLLLAGVIFSGAEAVMHFMPGNYPILQTLHRAGPTLLSGWGVTGLCGIGVFLTRGRRPYACVVFVALFLAGYIVLAPAMYQRVTAGVWLAGLGAVLATMGAWQLVERDRGSETE